jgi:hypothetical protein
MAGMKLLVVLALGIACSAVQAQSSPPQKRVDNFTVSQAEKPAKLPERLRLPTASVAVTLTDDVDSIWLPPFASRTTAAPMRFLRVGLEWSF